MDRLDHVNWSLVIRCRSLFYLLLGDYLQMVLLIERGTLTSYSTKL